MKISVLRKHRSDGKTAVYQQGKIQQVRDDLEKGSDTSKEEDKYDR